MSTDSAGVAPQEHTVSVVVPVYAGERTLEAVVADIHPLVHGATTADGHRFRVSEVILVHDHGPDDSPTVMRALAATHGYVRPVWLSRNFGQHAATMAGMASSGGDWIVTMDEDGQHDATYIGAMLDVAMQRQAQLVYASPTNVRPHGLVRNLASSGARWLIGALTGGGAASDYHSFRLMLGEVGRGVAAYAGAGVYLDVALGWIAGSVATCPVELRGESDRPSGYRFRTLMSHFWRLVLTSGTRLLRLVSVVGALLALAGVTFAVVLVVTRLTQGPTVPGWTSVMVVVLVTSGFVLVALGVVAEYLGVAVNMAMGKPLYMLATDPAAGPFGRAPADQPLDSRATGS